MLTTWLMGLGFALAAEVDAPSRPTEARVPRAVVKLIDDVEVPAEEAARLVAIHVREGARVEQGKTLLGQLDDGQAAAALRIADAELKASLAKARNDVDVRYARAATDVAQAELDAAREANRRVPGTKPAIEIKKLELALKQATLQIEQTEHELQLAGLEADGRQARRDASELDVRRRQLLAPINGEVVEIRFHPGEWVQPGDKVMRIVRLDRLRIEGSVNAKDFTPSELNQRPVNVRVRLERGREETFTGQVVFVSPIVQFGGDFQVLAEVSNRQEGGQWLLRAGFEADMTIDLQARPVAAAAR